MRKVNRLVGRTDPDTLFSQGVAKIVTEKKSHPTDYRDYELDSILRKEKALSRSTRKAQLPSVPGSADLLGRVVWKTTPNTA